MSRLEWKNDTLVESVLILKDPVVVDVDRDMVRDPLDLDGVEAVVLTFPVLRDGRAFSQARALRRQGFDGDICARGALFRDQILFAIRCGFTSFELDNPAEVKGILESVKRYPAYYQRAVVGAPIWEARI